MTRALALVALLAAPTALAAQTPGASGFAENCAACHQADGKGIAGAFPPLAASRFVLGPEAPVVGVVLNGRGGMPAFRDELDDARIADILTHVRSAWGNKAAPVAKGSVTRERGGAAAAKKDVIQAH